MTRVVVTMLCLSTLFIASCRGVTSDKPPIHVNPNMATQNKYKPYRESEFFTDKRDMRPMVDGTVARGFLKDDDAYYTGKIDGLPVKTLPLQVVLDKTLLERGRGRFNIYCAPCHSQSGSGDGIVGRRLPVKPTSLHSDYLYAQPVGHFFDAISHGIRTMPAYDKQIPESDRWAIVAYIRALQLSQNAELKFSDTKK